MSSRTAFAGDSLPNRIAPPHPTETMNNLAWRASTGNKFLPPGRDPITAISPIVDASDSVGECSVRSRCFSSGAPARRPCPKYVRAHRTASPEQSGRRAPLETLSRTHQFHRAPLPSLQPRHPLHHKYIEMDVLTPQASTKRSFSTSDAVRMNSSTAHFLQGAA